MSATHLDEWQKRSFDILSGTCTPEQTADAYRAHILAIQYAWASQELSPAAAASLLRTYSERYAAVLDSDDPRTGLNNYAASALHVARNQKNHSDKWESSLSRLSVQSLPCVQRMMQPWTGVAGKSLVTPADVNVVVGGESSGSNRSHGNTANPSTSGSRAELSHPSGVELQSSRGEGRGAPSHLPGSVAERPKEWEGIPSWAQTGQPPVSFPAKTQPGVSPLFGQNTGNSMVTHQPTSAGYTGSQNHQSGFFSSSSSNPSKRKNFYSSASENNKSGYSGHEGQDPRTAGRRGEEGTSKSFKTAREQLIVDHQKKNSQQPQRAQPSGWGATTKKSLGANRSRGTFSKFVSPLPRQEEEAWAASEAPQESELIDERLKNFEPKIIELIMSEIMDHGPPVAWDDIAGLEFAKTTIKEIVVWPMLRPDIFTGLRGPPKGILLFGPPGTGKTLIGKCIACQSGATFFSISASSLTSKWVGEGEKMVRALFAIARCHQPAVIFIDEIDSLLSQRTDGEHESSRRIKTEFLVQLDGAATSADDRILVVGATNRPQEIDEAARRRLAKRLYIPLPEGEARRKIVVNLMSREKSQLGPEELEGIVRNSEGFSGADMTQLCREAALGPIRSIQLSDMATITAEQVRPIVHSDFQEALRTVRPSVSSKDLELYENWNNTFGCGR
ncbi:fidgetin-like protein 1 [Clupea harengus]|uniref:Fidgetin-like protein 1 n=1 Tax=Clupea harengus TaxID=7950 RepID=A0A6P8G5X5_CLUHA|nr:fidgetin-like protein 1 [Clupea harengus]